MLDEKRMLSLEELDAEIALELPDRTLPQVTVVITNLLTGNTVTIDVRNVDVALQLCANLIATGNFECTVQQ